MNKLASPSEQVSLAPNHVPVYLLRTLPILGFRHMRQALDYLYADGQLKYGILVAINAEKMLTIDSDAQTRQLIHAAEYRYADGISIVRSVNKKYPQAQLCRLPGIDLWQALMQRAAERQTPIFLVGGKPDILAHTEKKLRQQWQVNIVGIQHGYFSDSERQVLITRIAASGARLVCVAMGSPRQEIFMQDCKKNWPDALYMGVGGSFDVFTGHIKRAPTCWQNAGLEWLYRLLSQPSRIKRQLRLWRYLYWHYSGRL